MKPLNRFLALAAVLILAAAVALAVLNWAALSAVETWQLGFTEVQWPVGAMILLLAVAAFVPLAVAYLRNVIETMIDTRRMLRDVQRLQKLADLAEASRIDGLRELVDREFSRVHARLDTLRTGGPSTDVDPSQGAPLEAGAFGPGAVGLAPRARL